eukprot:UN01795
MEKSSEPFIAFVYLIQTEYKIQFKTRKHLKVMAEIFNEVLLFAEKHKDVSLVKCILDISFSVVCEETCLVSLLVSHPVFRHVDLFSALFVFCTNILTLIFLLVNLVI